MKKGIYESTRSPYLKLLKLAKVEFSDVKSMILRVGIEETLRNLREEGVYLTHEEFKCVKKVIRKGEGLRFDEKDFDNPYLSTYYEVESDETKSAGTRTMIDLGFLQSTATYDSIAFNISNIMMLLNVESDDYGILEERNCDCELGRLGFTEHLHDIRSFGKLTSEGMTFVGTDLIRIIKEILPRKFGGSSIDYQLLEGESGNGLTQLSILVNPQVGKINERELVDEFLTELGEKKGTCAELWSQANTIKMKHMHPIPTKRGKVFPFYIRMK